MNKWKIATIASVALLSSTANAGGYTSWSTPTHIEHVNGGLLIGGSFGDPQGCGMANYIFIPGSNTKFREIVAMAYMAMASSREIRFYSSSCVEVTSHWTGAIINANKEAQAAMMR